ncbi:MAG: hypothetical protein LC733_04505 [Actinobacteria bacterium]|nr:hypothetical protein [Actinomycetota bacterium]
MHVRVGVPSRALSPAFAVLVSLALALSMSACGKKGAPQTTAPAGFTVVRDAGAGFAVAVPGDWQRIPLPGDLDDFDKQSRALANRNPKLSPAILQARQLLQSGGKLMAVSPDGVSIINLTVDKADEKTLTEIGRVTSAKLQEAGATNLAQEPATTGAGPALKLRFRLPIEGQGGETQEANETQYFVLHDGKSFVLTFQNATDDLAASVAGSLRLR